LDDFGGFLEHADAVRSLRRHAVAVAGHEDPLLSSDDHREGSLDHDADLLDLVFVRLDHRLWRVVVDDDRRVIGVDDAAFYAG
jgi:hypothetical protein